MPVGAAAAALELELALEADELDDPDADELEELAATEAPGGELAEEEVE